MALFRGYWYKQKASLRSQPVRADVIATEAKDRQNSVHLGNLEMPGKLAGNFNRRDIPALTGLRGVAAVWVVAFHLTQIPIVRSGYLGVDIFFILSGFVLSYVYADRLKPRDFRGYLRFLQARLVRIYPSD